jgi:hypothetical protein
MLNHFAKPQFLACALIVALGQTAGAHFVWLKLDAQAEQPTAELFFSEAGDIPGEKIPGGVGEAEVWLVVPGQERAKLELTKLEAENGDVSLHAPISKCDACAIETECTYGLYHGILLTYYSRSLHASSAEDLSSVADSNLKLDIIPELVDAGMKLKVTWNGEPVVDAPFAIVTPGGDEVDEKTDGEGMVVVSEREAGLYSFRTNHNLKDVAGEYQGEAFTEQHHYATLTYEAPAAGPGAEPLKKVAEKPTEDASASRFTPLPEGVASFGGAVSEGRLYVYSGHIGRAHDHSSDNLSQNFRRLDLSSKEPWESLPMETPLQGLALVAHDGLLYRIGGMQAFNAPGKDEVLKSVAEFSCFDPTTKEWTRMADLPGGRSSHDAVVVGDSIYVVGGWRLDGTGDEGEWYDSALVIDLSDDSPEWKEFKCPFRRRALAAGTIHGKIFALGGMNEMSDIDRGVDIYDPKTDEWSKGPELLGDGMDGFGVSAWQFDDELFVSGASGIVHQLAGDGTTWVEVAKLTQERFFHRLLPLNGTEILAVGGASNAGHLRNLEAFPVAIPAVARK